MASLISYAWGKPKPKSKPSPAVPKPSLSWLAEASDTAAVEEDMHDAMNEWLLKYGYLADSLGPPEKIKKQMMDYELLQDASHDELKAEVDAKNPAAIFTMARKIFVDAGKTKDVTDRTRLFTESIRLFRVAAELNFTIAYTELALIHLKTHDFKESLINATLAAEDPRALYMLGAFYENGQGVDINHKLAKEYYEKAAGKGVKVAVETLNELHQKAGMRRRRRRSTMRKVPKRRLNRQSRR